MLPTVIFPPRSRSFSTIDEWKWMATSAETRSMTSGRRTLTRGFFALFAASLIGGGYKREIRRDQLIFRLEGEVFLKKARNHRQCRWLKVPHL